MATNIDNPMWLICILCNFINSLHTKSISSIYFYLEYFFQVYLLNNWLIEKLFHKFINITKIIFQK